MPLTLTLAEGVLPLGKVEQAISQLTTSFLEHHGMLGNKVMTPNITAHVNIIPKGLTFSGGKPVEGAWLETKPPHLHLPRTRFKQASSAQPHKLFMISLAENYQKKRSGQTKYMQLTVHGISMAFH